ncbi:RagB/SusD family nutrient uptake outer membrane protein [Arcticibacter tournemirensis]|uniref:RagB/SusD family nutrient uptake outer membrane protein n=1 Tax=Arcticibacter tournemirensis TaxID=699437 RepID=A0A4Q0MEI0_9SPHI|nr:RagB/SusD family nutrient uptake outer membrane protein [Arcticibacter tournemirensis]RXF71573.1 RagB/SusD family nutrient uptake outer membrane protein [Arcticibacter tournemirensis]
MKRIINIVLAACVIALTGCKDILDAPNQSSLEPEVVFSTPTLAQGTIAGILQSFGETNSYRGRYLVYYGINTDTEIFNTLRNSADPKAQLSNYTATADNTQMNTDNNAWAKFYESIERANFAIKGIRTYGNMADSRMSQALGELLTLRAVVYNDLIKGWGDVPARFEPVTSETLNVPRSDKDVIYKQLLADLDEAASLLPWPNETSAYSSVERVNKAFAKGLRARLALAAGGYSLHLDGTIRLSTDPELSRDKMYAIAKKECLDIINSGKLRLLGFEECFRTLNEETGRAGLESMWEIPFSESRGRVIFDLGVKHTTKDKYTNQNKGGTNGPNALMLYEYERGDVRRDVTVVPYEWTNGKQVPTQMNKLYFGKYRYEWMKRIVTSDNDDGLNWMYMRYADVILMAAEAINELEGPANAAPYLRLIRARAFPNDAAKVNQFMSEVTVSKEAFFNAIVNERALEFTGEMLRKADLIRWNLLGPKLAEAKTKLIQLENKQGKYAGRLDKIYYKTAPDGEKVMIYGLNIGDTEAEAIALGYTTNKAWNLSAGSGTVPYWDALAAGDPNKQQVWPIWSIFIENSNAKLNNDHLGTK